MKLTPQSLTTDRLIASVRSQSDPRVTHTVTANRTTGAVWCSASCKARGEHVHTKAMAQLLADLARIQANQHNMDDAMLSHQVEWLHPDRVGFVALAFLSAQDILYSRQTVAA